MHQKEPGLTGRSFLERVYRDCIWRRVLRTDRSGMSLYKRGVPDECVYLRGSGLHYSRSFEYVYMTLYFFFCDFKKLRRDSTACFAAKSLHPLTTYLLQAHATRA